MYDLLKPGLSEDSRQLNALCAAVEHLTESVRRLHACRNISLNSRSLVPERFNPKNDISCKESLVGNSLGLVLILPQVAKLRALAFLGMGDGMGDASGDRVELSS